MAKYVYKTTAGVSRILNRTPPASASISMAFLKLPPQFSRLSFPFTTSSSVLSKSLYYSTTATPYPLQYDMIISRPANQQNRISDRRRRGRRLLDSPRSNTGDPEDQPESEELGFDDWVDKKLSSAEMDKSKRKYYNKRRKRMYGTDSEDENNRQQGNDLVELKQEVVELRTLHKREEELYFYDTFAYPWEKDKHYKMVYQMEKKYFPDQGFDKAFLDPGQSNERDKKSKSDKPVNKTRDVKEKDEEDKKMLFFDDEGDDKEKVSEAAGGSELKIDVSEKKVEEFFKCLRKVPNENSETANPEPFLSSRSTGLPRQWDTPRGSVVLVNKPKGWTSFTVCGKLRRLVKVKKVGHAGTLDPMATGLLIVCIGKATKVVDSYQGMVKGYSGIFRLGEATSTWDADSPVIQREPWEHIKEEDLKKIAASFCGEIWQVPPMFSAIKVGGEKMYEKARRGESIELSPRRISIFQFDVERSLEDRQNVIFRVTCSKGTYIRSLCADFGKALGSCAHLTALRRDSIGEYLADDAWEFRELEEAITKSYL
ncbi:OLC1v1011280C1 [Oldenlandia corymbosa var. corymbosa]|uniref:tRNA pseudouridine(55) synthase n=1 Tax=Oldenlandia corymbosa var. corymbosa TaxID=529605 RepID=A0AAV1DWL4_OLDCO|nr:OLC1v1011280C1 [Oldenlandia corymbosa var. corymbosa]